MSDLPEPLTPPDADLRGMPYMPLDIARLLDSDFYALSTGDEFKAAVTLWCKAFGQLPAGSLPADDRLLAHLSGAGPAWATVRTMALHGWVKCSDGRLYHRTVAETVAGAWKARQDRRARTEAARAARQARSVTDDVATSVTENVADDVTSSKGTEGNRREDKILPSADAGASDARRALWSDGLGKLRRLTGLPDGKARALLGRLCRDAGDDCGKVLAAIEAADDLRPGDPVAWLTAAVRPSTSPRNGFATIAAEAIGRVQDNPVTAFLAVHGGQHVH